MPSHLLSVGLHELARGASQQLLEVLVLQQAGGAGGGGGGRGCPRHRLLLVLDGQRDDGLVQRRGVRLHDRPLAQTLYRK